MVYAGQLSAGHALRFVSIKLFTEDFADLRGDGVQVVAAAAVVEYGLGSFFAVVRLPETARFRVGERRLAEYG